MFEVTAVSEQRVRGQPALALDVVPKCLDVVLQRQPLRIGFRCHDRAPLPRTIPHRSSAETPANLDQTLTQRDALAVSEVAYAADRCLPVPPALLRLA